MTHKLSHTATLVARAPIVAVMGHIDHGKSTLLDYIRKTKVTEGEAGGITQHVSAYEAEHIAEDGKKHSITFLDTPGHEAFQALRRRGAKVADIAILVVSAEDGVKPQTIEAYKAIGTAGIPFIVAINKIDKPSADVDRAKQSLAEHEIYVEGYGGTVPAVPLSAKTGQGVPELMDMIELVADLAELKANPAELASGVVIESNLDPKKGISATLIIKSGTLKSGLFVTAGKAMAPVRIMEDSNGKPIKEATFSSPVRIIGWNELVVSGSPFKTFEKKQDAIDETMRAAESERFSRKGADASANTGEATAGGTGVAGTMPENQATFPLVIKADTVGSLEAIAYEISKMKKDDRISIKVLDQGLGQIGEGDVKLASSHKNAAVIGFNVKLDASGRALAERDSVPVETFNIIYKLTDWIAEALATRTPKTQTEEVTGRAKILKIFSKTRDKQIIGGRVEEGVILVGEHVKILRRDADIGTGKIRELQKQKQAVKEIEAGSEFGSLVESKIEIAPGDVLVSFKIVEK